MHVCVFFMLLDLSWYCILQLPTSLQTAGVSLPPPMSVCLLILSTHLFLHMHLKHPATFSLCYWYTTMSHASENPIYKKLFLWSLSKSHLTKLHSHLFLTSNVVSYNCFCSPFTSPELFVFSERKRDWLKGQRMATSIPERSFEALSISQKFLFNYFNKEFSLLLKKQNKTASFVLLVRLFWKVPVCVFLLCTEDTRTGR